VIVGSYVMFLYCRHGTVGADDGCAGPDSFRFEQSKHEFTESETASAARRVARRSGWVFHADGDVSCPWCAKRKLRQER
jgi:hypothetical protein